MPKIPSYEGLQVQQTAAPVPKISTEIPSIEAFGGGKSLQALDTLDKVILQAKKEADETFVRDAENKVRTLRNKYLFDEKDGFLNKTTKSLDKNDPDNIFIQSEKYTNDFEKEIENIQKNLSEEQKALLQNSILDVRNNFNESITKHLNNETEIFRKATLATNIDVLKEEAINNSHDPIEINKSLEIAQARLDELAQIDSKLAGSLDVKKKELVSDVYESIFKKRAENFSRFGMLNETKQLYEQVKDKILSSSQLKIEKVLKTSGDMYEGSFFGTSLFNDYQSGKINQEEALSKILKIQDKEKRDFARDTFTQNVRDFNRAKKEDESLNFDRAFNLIIESDGSLEIFQKYSSLFASLPASQYKTLYDLSNSLRLEKFQPKVSSAEVIGQLNLMDADELREKLKDPSIRKELSKQDYTEYLTKLNTGNNSKQFKMTKALKDSLVSNYRQAGLTTPSPTKGGETNRLRHVQFNEFFKKANERLSEIKNPTQEDADKIAKDLLKKYRFEESKESEWFPDKIDVFEFEGFSEEKYQQIAKEVDIEEIDPKSLKQLKEAYKKANGIDYDKSQKKDKRKILYELHFQFLKGKGA
jgi:hypothetical protein